MTNYIEERSERLFEASNRFSKLDSLFGECKLPENIFRDLRACTKICLYDTLSSYYNEKYFKTVLELEDFCELYKDFIFNLPNITPNGLLMPKVETNNSHNIFNKQAFKLIEYLSFEESTRIACPVNLRINFGLKTNPKILNRPRSSTNWHTDIWAGQNCNEAMIHTPICGDFESSGIKTCNPQDGFFPDYVKSLNSFVEGREVTDKMDDNCINITMSLGKIYALDSFLFHKTSLSSSKIRIILSFPIRLIKKVSSDIYENHLRDEEFISLEEWSDLGKNTLIVSNEHLKKENRDDKPKDYYAGKFKKLNIK